MKRAFVNGKFYLCEENFAQAVICENGFFTHVGSSNDIQALAAGCEVIKLSAARLFTRHKLVLTWFCTFCFIALQIDSCAAR